MAHDWFASLAHGACTFLVALSALVLIHNKECCEVHLTGQRTKSPSRVITARDAHPWMATQEV